LESRCRLYRNGGYNVPRLETHASQLIAAGVDLVTIAKRLGHSSPNITLGVYAHLFRNNDSKASEAINQALADLKW
jgi:integrase